MNDEQIAMIRKLKHEGYAVAVFYPEEVGTANPRRVENRLIELASDVIEELNDED